MVSQLWKEFRRQNHTWHRRMGYVAVIASALGSMSAAPYAVTYLLSARLPETVISIHLRTGFVNAALLSTACVLLQGTGLLAHAAVRHVMHHGACIQQVDPTLHACSPTSLPMYAMPSWPSCTVQSYISSLH